MKLKCISIKNFRSVREVIVDVSDQTAIIGGNGSGKSTILRALDRFYGQSTNVESDDFFGRNLNNQIEIGLTFHAFDAEEQEKFEPRIHNDEMTVVRVFDSSGGRTNGKYYGATNLHRGFADIRAESAATPKRRLYDELRTSDTKYRGLNSVSRADQIPPELEKWEGDNPNECELLRDDGQFFGFTNVARGSLQRSTSFVFIPAVREASADAIDARGAVISRLMELVVRSAVQRRRDIIEWQKKVSDEYRDIIDPSKLKELGLLSTVLSATLQDFYREAAVILKWQPAEPFSVPLPIADVFLNDDGFEGPVDRKGHGLQRALILTLLQHLAKATSEESRREDPTETTLPELDDILAVAEMVGDERSAILVTEAVTEDAIIGSVHAAAIEPKEVAPETIVFPGLILAIEEPELYQHPTKQRHFARVLSNLSSGQIPGVAKQMQVLFATHSPLFVSVDRFEEIKLARRIKRKDAEHKECRITQANLSGVVEALEHAYEKPKGTFSEPGLVARLHILNQEIAEGFFAHAAVLVEGVSDKAALSAAAELEGTNFEALGVALVFVDGKTKLDRPAAIFLSLGIPTFVVWDCDKSEDVIKDEIHNRALQRIMGVPDAAVVGAATIFAENFACFESKLEKVLRAEIGAELYDKCLEIVKATYGITKNDEVEKSPYAMKELLRLAAESGGKSESLSKVVGAIKQLVMAETVEVDDGSIGDDATDIV